MPEIVEVRVVANTLKKNLLGKKVKKINILYPRIVEGNTLDFKKTLEGKTFKNVSSIGKWLVFDLGEYSLLSHLRMEGKYFYVLKDTPLEKHTHVVFELSEDMELRYNDVRKFGRMLTVKTKEIYENEHIKKLGYEPESKNLTEDYLIDAFKKLKKPIKTVLLDQTVINGLGNIYANEVLFASRIDPRRPANTITKKEARTIIDSSRKIVKRSYKKGGSTIRSYTSSLGVTGHFQDYLKVHTKENEPCSICGNPIKKIKIDGRSTYYCEKCQK